MEHQFYVPCAQVAELLNLALRALWVSYEDVVARRCQRKSRLGVLDPQWKGYQGEEQPRYRIASATEVQGTKGQDLDPVLPPLDLALPQAT